MFDSFKVSICLVSCESKIDDSELTALTRDGLARDNPDSLINGYRISFQFLIF